MAFVHGKGSSVVLSGLSGPASGSHDLSTFLNQVTWEFGSDTHDVTTFGQNSHVWASGLKVSTFSIGGIYDGTNPATNTPWFVLQQANGNLVTIVFKPEGTGTGKPSHSFSAVLTKFNISDPVADMISFQADFNGSGDITSSIQ